MDITRFRVGDVEGVRFVHRRGRGTPRWMFPDVPAAPLARRMQPYVDASGTFAFVDTSLMLRTHDGLALLDAGHAATPGHVRSQIEEALLASGVTPPDVGVVVISHGHMDHIGGLTRGGRPVFARARHLIDRRELRFWTTGARADSDAAAVLRPLLSAGLVDAVDGAHDVLDGVRLLPAPGHTPGHAAVAISSRGERALYVGDTLAHEVNVAEPGWNHFSDRSPTQAATSRRRLVERAARDGSALFGSHVATHGRAVATRRGGFRYVAETPAHR